MLSAERRTLQHKLQVLHLAEFLHNRPSDPMCAKALWRRAAARKVSCAVLASLVQSPICCHPWLT